MKTQSAKAKAINPRNPNQFKTPFNDEGRECTSCGDFKKWSDFKSHSRSHTGRSSKCKKCYKEGRKANGRKSERYSSKARRAYLKKNEPYKFKAQSLRASLMKRTKELGLDRSCLPTRVEIQEWLENTPLVCYYSGVPLEISNLHVDHKVPLSRGGGSDLSNLCLTCPKMNSSKGKLTDLEFQELLSLISKWEDNGVYLLSRLRMGWRVS